MAAISMVRQGSQLKPGSALPSSWRSAKALRNTVRHATPGSARLRCDIDAIAGQLSAPPCGHGADTQFVHTLENPRLQDNLLVWPLTGDQRRRRVKGRCDR